MNQKTGFWTAELSFADTLKSHYVSLLTIP